MGSWARFWWALSYAWQREVKIRPALRESLRFARNRGTITRQQRRAFERAISPYRPVFQWHRAWWRRVIDEWRWRRQWQAFEREIGVR